MASFLDSHDIGGLEPSTGEHTVAGMRDELALLIDGATNYAIYMLDPDGRVTIWNRGAERIKDGPRRRSSAMTSRSSTPLTRWPPASRRAT